MYEKNRADDNSQIVGWSQLAHTFLEALDLPSVADLRASDRAPFIWNIWASVMPSPSLSLPLACSQAQRSWACDKMQAQAYAATILWILSRRFQLVQVRRQHLLSWASDFHIEGIAAR